MDRIHRSKDFAEAQVTDADLRETAIDDRLKRISPEEVAASDIPGCFPNL